MKALLALTAVVAAIGTVAPMALASNDARGGYRFITDTLGGNGHAQAPQGYRFITDTLGGNGGAPLPVSAPGSSFDWTAAGVGAVTGVGAVFVVLGGTLLAARRRGRLAV
jgi:hypothetical protein